MGIEAFGLRPSHPLCYAMLCYDCEIFKIGRPGAILYNTFKSSFNSMAAVQEKKREVLFLNTLYRSVAILSENLSEYYFQQSSPV